MNYILGETNVDIKLQTAEENKDLVLSLARQAHHKINIFSQQLDAPLYDNDEFEKYIFNLANSHRSAEVRILLQNSSHAMQHSHRLVRLAQKLTSSILIRKPAEKYKDLGQAYITIDGVGMLYRAQGDVKSYNATANFMSPQNTSELDASFNEIWDHSDPDPQLRRLSI